MLRSGQAATASAAARQAVGGSPLRETRVTFAELGAGSISLQGVQSTAGLDLGIRKDEVVVSAVLHLRLTYSPSLIPEDRKSTRLNSSHSSISYAVFCLKKK